MLACWVVAALDIIVSSALGAHGRATTHQCGGRSNSAVQEAGEVQPRCVCCLCARRRPPSPPWPTTCEWTSRDRGPSLVAASSASARKYLGPDLTPATLDLMAAVLRCAAVCLLLCAPVAARRHFSLSPLHVLATRARTGNVAALHAVWDARPSQTAQAGNNGQQSASPSLQRSRSPIRITGPLPITRSDISYYCGHTPCRSGRLEPSSTLHIPALPAPTRNCARRRLELG